MMKSESIERYFRTIGKADDEISEESYDKGFADWDELRDAWKHAALSIASGLVWNDPYPKPDYMVDPDNDTRQTPLQDILRQWADEIERDGCYTGPERIDLPGEPSMEDMFGQLGDSTGVRQ